jgi:NhaA family Na+:H+ antiporter
MLAAVREFLRMESASGILLLIASVLAMVMANSPLSHLYDLFLDTPVAVKVGAFEIAKPLLLWINDGLMALFFFLVGLEIKREVVEGELSKPAQVVLPALAAVGGMAAPAIIYALANWGEPRALQGWAIPVATDIAFALGVLSLLGKRVPPGLKVFLLTLAIFDDLGAIIIIALFYSAHLSVTSLVVAGGALAVLFVMNRRHVSSIPAYLLVGLVLWVSVLKSGVHATLAGVLLAMFIPMRDREDPDRSPLRQLEHELHPAVAFAILPLFAFANAGVNLTGLTLDSVLHPVPLGIAAGLFLGNQLGIFTVVWLAVRLGIAQLPNGVNWVQMYGVAVMCGIGFTMSLFISALAFEGGDGGQMADDRIGILAGSLVSAVVGYLILRASLQRRADPGPTP